MTQTTLAPRKTTRLVNPPLEKQKQPDWLKVHGVALILALPCMLVKRFGKRIAEDVGQDTGMTLLRRLRDGRLTHVWNFPAWIRRTAYNLAARMVQRESRYCHDELTEEPMTVLLVRWGQDAIDPKEQKDVLEAICSLPHEHRELLVQHYLDGWSLAELATLHDLSSSRVCYRLRCAIQLIRAELRKNGYKFPDQD